MAFLRNALVLYDYGDFVDESSKDTGAPFVQLLPLTDPARAHATFVQKRLGGVDSTGAASKALLPPSQMQHSPQTDAEKKAELEGKVLRQWPYILLGGLVLVGGIVGLIVWRCCCGRNRGRGCCGRRKAAAAPTIPMSGHGQRYQSLQEPAPNAYRDPYAYKQ
jgi:hypothetical protein